MKITQIDSKKLKALLGAEMVRKQYENKHVGGSGNFGYAIKIRDRVYNIHGDYAPSKEIRNLHVRPLGSLMAEDHDRIQKIHEALKHIEEGRPVERVVESRTTRNRDKGANRIEDIDGIKFVSYIKESDERMRDVVQTAMNLIERKKEKLKGGGFMRVELDSLGGYYFRNISKGRFIPLNTMHQLRLLRR